MLTHLKSTHWQQQKKTTDLVEHSAFKFYKHYTKRGENTVLGMESKQRVALVVQKFQNEKFK